MDAKQPAAALESDLRAEKGAEALASALNAMASLFGEIKKHEAALETQLRHALRSRDELRASWNQQRKIFSKSQTELTDEKHSNQTLQQLIEANIQETGQIQARLQETTRTLKKCQENEHRLTTELTCLTRERATLQYSLQEARHQSQSLQRALEQAKSSHKTLHMENLLLQQARNATQLEVSALQKQVHEQQDQLQEAQLRFENDLNLLRKDQLALSQTHFANSEEFQALQHKCLRLELESRKNSQDLRAKDEEIEILKQRLENDPSQLSKIFSRKDDEIRELNVLIESLRHQLELQRSESRSHSSAASDSRLKSPSDKAALFRASPPQFSEEDFSLPAAKPTHARKSLDN